jgi:hypothetical protein
MLGSIFSAFSTVRGRTFGPIWGTDSCEESGENQFCEEYDLRNLLPPCIGTFRFPRVSREGEGVGVHYNCPGY